VKTLRTELVEARGIAVKRKEECEKLHSELVTLTTKLVEVRGLRRRGRRNVKNSRWRMGQK
jgi:hypothetical protein